MQDPQQKKSGWVGLAALIVASVALVLAGYAVVRHQQLAPIRAATEEQDNRFTALTGLTNQAATNSLADRYADANGDLVADAPTDPAKQRDPAKLTFSYLAVEDDQSFRPAFEGLMAAIAKATGKPVEYVAYSDVIDQLRDLRDGKLAIAGLNTGSVPLGVCQAGFVPLCQPADAGGAAGYHMQLIVPADSPMNALADVRGHELTLTTPTSNSGYKAPLVLLRQNGLVPPRDYLIRYSMGQVQSILGVKDHSYEVAPVASDVLQREQAAGHIAAADYRTIYTSDQTFPSPAIGCAHDLKPELAAKIRDAMLAYDWAGTPLQKLFAAEGKAKFVPADYRKSWEYVRLIDDSIGTVYELPSAALPAVHPKATTATAPAAAR